MLAETFSKDLRIWIERVRLVKHTSYSHQHIANLASLINLLTVISYTHVNYAKVPFITGTMVEK